RASADGRRRSGLELRRSRPDLDAGAVARSRAEPEFRADCRSSLFHRDEAEALRIDLVRVEADPVVLDAKVQRAAVREPHPYQICVSVVAGIRDGLAHDAKKLLSLLGADLGCGLGRDLHPGSEAIG